MLTARAHKDSTGSCGSTATPLRTKRPVEHLLAKLESCAGAMLLQPVSECDGGRAFQ